jgi:hypothetical protein
VELLTLFEAISNIRNVLSERQTTLREDLDAMSYLRKSSTYPEDENKRRKVLALEAAISTKQTVQKSLLVHLERAIHLVLGEALTNI